jgi:oryzin
MAYKSLLTIALAGLATAFAAPDDDAVPGKFIVTLQPDAGLDLTSHTEWVSEVHVRNLRRRGGDTSGVEKTFNLLHAYSGSFDEETLEIIKANSSVSST